MWVVNESKRVTIPGDSGAYRNMSHGWATGNDDHWYSLVLPGYMGYDRITL